MNDSVRALFDDLHARFERPLNGLFRRRLPHAVGTADDLAQRSWFALWQALTANRYDPSRSSPSTFLFAIAHKIWVQHLRESGRRGARERGDAAAVSVSDAAADSAVDAVALAETLQRLRDLLKEPSVGGLTENERDLLLAAAAGETDRNTAAKYGLAPSTVHARRRTALEKLRGYLTGKPGAVPASDHP